MKKRTKYLCKNRNLKSIQFPTYQRPKICDPTKNRDENAREQSEKTRSHAIWEKLTKTLVFTNCEKKKFLHFCSSNDAFHDVTWATTFRRSRLTIVKCFVSKKDFQLFFSFDPAGRLRLKDFRCQISRKLSIHMWETNGVEIGEEINEFRRLFGN